MVDLKKLKDVSFKLDERGKLRAQIGLNLGILPMFIAAFVAVVILSDLQLWYKVAAGIGLGCAAIMQLGGAIGAIGRYKAYNNAMAEFERLNTNTDPVPYAG
jgi:hypothetical protein